ncbi:MAG: transglycosylase domain-containing protein [Bryobacteraceae bacterium]
MKWLWLRPRDYVRSYFQNATAERDRALLKRFPFLLRAFALVAVILSVAFVYQYYKYAMLIEDKLGRGGMRTNSSIYAAPKLLSLGDPFSPLELIAHLQRAGYTEAAENRTGHYRRTTNGVDFSTGPGSYFQPYSATIEFKGNQVARIISNTEKKPTEQISLEPELITNLFDGDREKRRPVNYSELPPHLVHAIVSIEDKRFFQHGGLDLLRVLKAVYVDIKERSKEQGASTLTMQLARSFWLEQDKTWKRKFAEILLTSELERRFDKKQIMELYANEVYLGRRGSFSIHGFGEAARTYFDKDVRKLTIPEAAMLAAIIQRPGFFNPFRFPERVRQRRDLVLKMMHDNGFVDAAQLTSAVATPIEVHAGKMESTDAPYFVDLVNKEIDEQFKDWDFATNAYRVYSTLDLELQRDAVEAVQAGMQEVDKQVKRIRARKKIGALPQVALIALDPKTGAIKALVGGRSYQDSQLNRVLAKRQPGSSFKPFVYAAALNTAVERKTNIVTAAMAVADEPTTFIFNNQKYEPGNYHDQYHGNVSLRQALAKSLNIPTIKLAEKIGYETVVKLARAAGIESPLQGTPSLALGSYEVPPLEIAEA